MTLTADPETVAAAQDRGGDVDPERPEEIDATLNREELGFGEGPPLVEGVESYQKYPSPGSMSNPKYGTLLRRLMSHPLVGGYDDCVTELTGATDSVTRRNYRTALENAAGAFDFDAGELFSQGREEREQGREDRLTALLGYTPPEGMVGPGSPLVVAELYTLGLSADEIADVLGDRMDRAVRVGKVTDTLKRAGLLGGPTRDEERSAFEENEGRLGRTVTDMRDERVKGNSGGLTVHTSDF